MKKNQIVSIFTISIVLMLGFSGISTAKSTLSNISNQKIFENTITQIEENNLLLNFLDNDDLPTWYPGWLIVQILKGIIALILTLLILLDLIEP